MTCHTPERNEHKRFKWTVYHLELKGRRGTAKRAVFCHISKLFLLCQLLYNILWDVNACSFTYHDCMPALCVFAPLREMNIRRNSLGARFSSHALRVGTVILRRLFHGVADDLAYTTNKRIPIERYSITNADDSIRSAMVIGFKTVL